MAIDLRFFVLLGSSWLMTGLTVRADLVFFARGGQVELPVVDHGQTVELIAPWGRLQFPRAAFRSIISASSLTDTWHQRELLAEQAGTASARFEAGWWALEHGLTAAAITMFRSARMASGATDHAPLMRVGRMLDQLDAPRPPAEDLAVEPLLGSAGWSRLAGRHVVLLHQATFADAAERLRVMDQVVETYHLSLAAQGIELPIPRSRLVSVWFAYQRDYIATLRRIDAAAFLKTQGFYHPGFAVVFAVDTRSIGDQAAQRLELESRKRKTYLTVAQQVEIDRITLLLDLQWRGVDLGIAAHETVHQLVAASRLAPHFDGWPNWLHEGFSAQFEVVRDGQWAGFGRINNLRLPDLRSIESAPQLVPLLRDTGLTHGYHPDRYAEAWALVYFLRKTRPTEFVTYLNLLQAPKVISEGSSTAEVIFKSAFGADLSALQTEWRRFMNQQILPGETQDTHQTGEKFRNLAKFKS